ncbi:MAG TPA: ArsB/NhaD family transporter [Ornithinibacter sp.]|nr:ArsB/NhaD family transporter [Ornithinibacter sp.]HQG16241.1 ArsB/NhaD family transporter [Ornithinibacter sp.]
MGARRVGALITEAIGALERLVPIVVFLLAITVVAEIAERAGVFDVAGHWVAHAGRHRAWALWVLFALANTGSLLLPVSNLTNLLALHSFQRQGLGHVDYLALAWAPALACVVVTLLLLVVLHRRTLAARYEVDPPADPHDPVLLRWSAVVCIALGPLFAVGAPPWAVSLVAAALLLSVGLWRAPDLLRGLPVPWLMAAGFVAVAVSVEVLHRHGLDAVVDRVVPSGTGATALLAVAGLGAGLANVVNNLPAYLIIEPAVADSSTRLMALLVGVNAGPLVTPWASLATLLWLARCRSVGVAIPWRWLVPAGAACAVLSVSAGTVALAFVT